MRTRFHVALLGAGVCFALGLVGCIRMDLTRTGPQQQPREEECDFEVFTVVPENHVEIGTVDGISGTSSLQAYKRQLQPYVCEAGGDAAVAYANGHGVYIKATVLKRQPPSAAEIVAATPAPAQAATGCAFDTQCKGDRICVSGQCVDPAPKESAESSTTAPPSAPAAAP